MFEMMGKVRDALPPSGTIDFVLDEDVFRITMTVKVEGGEYGPSTYEVPVDQGLLEFGKNLLGMIKWAKEQAEAARKAKGR